MDDNTKGPGMALPLSRRVLLWCLTPVSAFVGLQLASIAGMCTYYMLAPPFLMPFLYFNPEADVRQLHLLFTLFVFYFIFIGSIVCTVPQYRKTVTVLLCLAGAVWTIKRYREHPVNPADPDFEVTPGFVAAQLCLFALVFVLMNAWLRSAQRRGVHPLALVPMFLNRMLGSSLRYPNVRLPGDVQAEEHTLREEEKPASKPEDPQ